LCTLFAIIMRYQQNRVDFRREKRGCAGRKKWTWDPGTEEMTGVLRTAKTGPWFSGITSGNFSSPPDNQRKNYRFLIAFCRAFFWNFSENEFSIIPFLSWSAPENGLFFFQKTRTWYCPFFFLFLQFGRPQKCFVLRFIFRAASSEPSSGIPLYIRVYKRFAHTKKGDSAAPVGAEESRKKCISP
jgi:hypothetical protein